MLPTPRPSRPLRRLGVGAFCLVLSVTLVAISGATPSAVGSLRVAAAIGAIAGLGCLIAAGLAVWRNLFLRFNAAFPAGMHRLRIVLGYVVIFGLGALGIAWSIGGLVSGNAPLISRRSGTVSASDDPVYFWASVIFHFLLGLFLVLGGLYALYRRRKSAV